MSRVKYTTDNYCHKPIKGGERVEALIDAAAEGRLAAYLASGHSVNTVTDRGMSALHALARKGSGTERDKIALDALLSAGIDVNLLNYRKESALFRALVSKSTWLALPLLEAGADLQVVNSKGKSLMDIGSEFDAILSFSTASKLHESCDTPKRPSLRRSL